MAVLKSKIKKGKKEAPSKRIVKRKRIQREKGRAFREKLLARAKLFGYKTKFQQLMRKYKKLQKSWKGKAEYPVIDYQTLQAERFKLTRKSIEGLMKQLEGSINKMDGDKFYTKDLLMSMLAGCILSADKNGCDPELIAMLHNLQFDPRFEAACDDISKQPEIYDILTLIYDIVGAGDDLELSNVISQLYDLL